MALMSNDPRVNEALKALGAPDRIVSFRVYGEVNEPVTMECTFNVDLARSESLPTGSRPTLFDRARFMRISQEFVLAPRALIEEFATLAGGAYVGNDRIKEISRELAANLVCNAS